MLRRSTNLLFSSVNVQSTSTRFLSGIASTFARASTGTKCTIAATTATATGAVVYHQNNSKNISSTATSSGMFRSTSVAFCAAPQQKQSAARSDPETANFTVGGRDKLADEATGEFDFDIVVIGGGSGGLAAAKRASKNGAKVALCDFVAPSPQGTMWGLGGTCVNVGCIPKKLMHTAAMVGETIRHTATFYGFGAEEDQFTPGKAMNKDEKSNAELINFTWQRLRQNVQDHIRGLNWGYLGDLRDNDVKYFNALASFEDQHTIKTVDKKGREKTIRARRFLIATGGRPSPLPIPGGEHAISSDDLFFGKASENPGKVCVVGAGYIALECAGLLHSLGFPCKVFSRSVPLRVMDQQCAEYVVEDMRNRIGVNILTGTSPEKITKDEATGKLKVEYMNEGKMVTEEFDTVLAAVGRYAETDKLNLDKLGVKVNPKSKKILTNMFDRTSVDNIYAIGDVAQDCPELTPVAIKAGQYLADRLYKNEKATTIDYRLVPTTVFTPLEYGFVGHNEQTAAQDYGQENIESYLGSFTPLEWTVPHLPNDACLMKMIVEKKTDKVIGFHVVSPNAGEITQGVSVALECGAKREDFMKTIGIHPTIGEEMTSLTVTKSSGESFKKGGC